MKTSQGISQVYGLIVAAASVMALAIVLDAPRWILLAMVTLVAAVGLWLAWVASTRTGTALAPLRRAIRDLQSAAGTPPHHSGDGEGVAHLPERIDQASGAFTSTLARADRARAVLSAVIRGLPGPVLATDASGVVVEANPAAEAFVGTGSRRLAGREINEVLTWTDLLRLHDQGRAGTVRERVRLMRADGQRVLDVLVEPVPLDPRSPESIVLMVIHDVTDQARALQVKADFVANASHELRTPIAAMRVAIDTLEALEPEDHDARARFLRMVSANVERLEEMVRDLLDLSRLEAAEDEPELTTLALSQIVGSLAPSFEAICAERRLTLSWELDPALEHLRTDRKLLLLVVQNLIDNATKFETVRVAPTFPPAVTNFCMALNYVDGVDPEETLAAHKHFGAVLDMFPKPLPIPAQWPNSRDPGKRLRVGLVSPDFHAHSVAYFVLAILEHHDRASVEYIGYSLNPKIDDMTRRLGPMMDGWRDVSRLADGPLVQQIRSDQCDVVVELTGQTFGNRLAALRLRAAPVQVTYCGYPNTTGVPAIDWRFVDSITDPPGAERWATERLLRLDPCFLCYTGDPAVAHDQEPPSVANGFITFGSFNSIKKVTPRVLELWAQVLHAVPRSRLIIKSPGIQAKSARQAISTALKQAGIPEVRFDLVERINDTADHLRAYNAVDIALDTFPYNGTTTTCEAMWMGVPVVTRTGATHASRVGASLLSAIGMPQLAAGGHGSWRSIKASRFRTARRLILSRWASSFGRDFHAATRASACASVSPAHFMTPTFSASACLSSSGA
ncbi:PAS domain S-box protein [Leptolyngbya sp. 15MV]|nr:PAS domain S-box protein [Leptolyngbya sp. 15MV]